MPLSVTGRVCAAGGLARRRLTFPSPFLPRVGLTDKPERVPPGGWSYFFCSFQSWVLKFGVAYPQEVNILQALLLVEALMCLLGVSLPICNKALRTALRLCPPSIALDASLLQRFLPHVHASSPATSPAIQ